MYFNHKGFTIVELLIVIVVIGILAAITIVGFNGVTARASDSQIRNAAAQLEKSIIAWSVQAGSMTIPGGWGSTTAVGVSGCIDGSSGFFGRGTYTCTAEDHLSAHKVIPSNFTASLPANKNYGSGTNGRHSMMLYVCGSGRYGLYWTLQKPTAEEVSNMNNVLSTCGQGPELRNTYGMQSGKIIVLNP